MARSARGARYRARMSEGETRPNPMAGSSPKIPSKPASQAAPRVPIAARVRDLLEVANTPFKFVQDQLRFRRSERRVRRRIAALLAGGVAPIVVYSAPKTASTSIASALDRTAGIDTVKVHFVRPEHFWQGPMHPKVAPDGLLRHRAIEQRPSREMLFAGDRPLRIVAVVREPIGFNLSNYTYFGRAYWMRTFWRSSPWIDAAALQANFRRTFPHESSSLWWTREFAASTGIDPIALGFDAARGWQRYRNARFDCLVIRADLDDSEKRAALREFTGLPVAEVVRENANDTQSAPGVYDRLRAETARDPGYVREMLALPSAQAFFTEGQRDAIARRWLGEPGRPS